MFQTPWVFLGFFSHLTKNTFISAVFGLKQEIWSRFWAEKLKMRPKTKKLQLMTKKGSSEILADKKEFLSEKVGILRGKVGFFQPNP